MYMENLPLILFIALIAFLVLCIVYLSSKLANKKTDPGPPPRPVPPRDPKDAETHELGVRIGESGKWEVRKNGELGPIRVRRGDTIIWKVEGTDAFFQFPFADLFHLDESKGPWTPEIGPGGGELRVVVSEKACPGSYVYCIFCNVSKKDNIPVTGFARGGSPPEFIIMF